MKITDRINQNFTQEKLIDTIAKYQLYYQLSLGVFVKETSFDQKDTMKTVQELNLDIDVENVLNTMVKIIINFNEEKEFNAIFDDNIKVNSMMHALDDFIGKSKNLVNNENIYESYSQKIQNDKFYDINMHVQFDGEIKDRIKVWEELITNEVATLLIKSAHKAI